MNCKTYRKVLNHRSSSNSPRAIVNSPSLGLSMSLWGSDNGSSKRRFLIPDGLGASVTCALLGLRLACERDRCQVFPKVLQGFHAAKQRRKYCGVGQQDVGCSLSVRGHPDERIELAVSSFSERMWPGHIDRLSGQHLNKLGVFRRQRIVWQMRVKIEGGNSF